MTERNWIPNHFVSALPIEISQKTEHQKMFDLKIQRWRMMRERKLAKDELKKVNISFCSTTFQMAKRILLRTYGIKCKSK